MEVQNFAEIETEFIQRVHSMVLCSAATVDAQGRPRSRILHPYWEGATGWINTHRQSFKAGHLDHNPHLSLAYIAQPFSPVYVECTAAWETDLAEKQRVWDLFKNAPPPLGFDPAMDFISPLNAFYGLLKLTPWRIDLVSFPAESLDTGTRVWRAKAGE